MKYCISTFNLFPGKTLLCKERAIETAEKEKYAENMGLKSKADPVYLLSLVGADEKGYVEQNEYIFDIYTNMYDFVNTDVKVITAQNLLDFYTENDQYGQSSPKNVFPGRYSPECIPRNIFPRKYSPESICRNASP